MKKKPAPPTPPRPRTRKQAIKVFAKVAGDLLALPHGCSIEGCESPRWKKGGRAGAAGVPELCPMHYHRELRDSPDALEPGTVRGGGERKLVGFRPPDDVREALAAWHAKLLKQFPGLSQGAVVEIALVEALTTRGYLKKDPAALASP